MSSVQQGLWLSLPVILGGLTHVVAIKKGVLSALTRLRLDGGVQLRGRDVFGENKTVRGAVVMVLATLFWTGVMDGLQTGLSLSDELRYIPKSQLGTLGLGLLLGGAYIAGELPNSFIKRQLDIAPGEAASGSLSWLFWLVDQVDSAVAVLLVLCLVQPPNFQVYMVVLGLTVCLHPAIAALMVALGLKRRVG
jgi:CDP-diglyceride synthetase